MSGKNQFSTKLNWQSTNPVPTFLPQVHSSGSAPSGVDVGVMSGTNTIYSQIIDLSRMDMVGLEVNWAGNPRGVLSIMGSVSGANFYAFTGFSATLAQPAGIAGGELIGLLWYPFRYLMLQYTNASGAGALTVYCQMKDWN